MVGNKRKDSDTSDSATGGLATAAPNKRQNTNTFDKSPQSEVESHVLRPSIVSPSVVMSQIRLASHKVRDYLAKDRLDGATLKLECFNYLNNRKLIMWLLTLLFFYYSHLLLFIIYI